MPGDDDWPVAAVPERLDRRARLGPFPSARDALKFLTYAAAGALLVPVAGAVAWLPFLAAGFAVAVWKPDGSAVDERAFAAARWLVRSRGGVRGMIAHARETVLRHRLVRWNGRYVAVVRAGGAPLAYLPPDELRSRFERYRDALRGWGDGWAMMVGAVPLHGASVRPARAAVAEAERAARDGYAELLDHIAARRPLRRVLLFLSDPDPGPEGIGRIEATSARAIADLGAAGVHAARLVGRELRVAVHRAGGVPATEAA